MPFTFNFRRIMAFFVEYINGIKVYIRLMVVKS